MADQQTWLVYHLPRTVVTLGGTVTEKHNLRTGKPDREVQSEISLATEADPAAFYRLDMGADKLSESTLALELTDDGRLVSTDAKSVGKLGKVVKNVVSFATTVVGVLGKAVLLGAGAVPMLADALPAGEEEKGDPVLERYRDEHPEQAARRQRLAAALGRITEKTLALEEELIDQAGSEDRAATRAHLEDLKKAAAELREEAKLADAHFAAWKAGKERVSTSTFELAFDLDDLPQIDAVEAWNGAPTQEQIAELGSYAEAYRLLGLVLARRDVTPLPSGGVSKGIPAGQAHEGVFFRQARPLDLALYALRGRELELVKTTRELVMDGACRLGFVRFGKTRWSERNAQLTFSAAGGLKTLTNFIASDAAAASDTLKELPAEVQAALKQANEIVDERQKLALQGIEQRIAELTKQKNLVDARIALGEVVDTRQQVEEAQRLQAEIDLLKARKDLGVARRELEVTRGGSTAQVETELLKTRTALEQAQVDRLKVEAELEKLRQAGIGGGGES